MNKTTLIRADELERILLETTPRTAVQRAVDLIAQSIPSCSVTVMGVDIDQRVHFDAANGIPWSVLRRVDAKCRVCSLLRECYSLEPSRECYSPEMGQWWTQPIWTGTCCLLI